MNPEYLRRERACRERVRSNKRRRQNQIYLRNRLKKKAEITGVIYVISLVLAFGIMAVLNLLVLNLLW